MMDYNVSIFPAHARGTLDVNNIFGGKKMQRGRRER